jgi:hypothetical protein
MDWLKKMMAGLTAVAALTFGAAGTLALTGCEDDAGDEMEEIGDNIEDAGDDAADDIEDATE